MLTLGNYTKHWTHCEKRTGISWSATNRIPGAHLEVLVGHCELSPREARCQQRTNRPIQKATNRMNPWFPLRALSKLPTIYLRNFGPSGSAICVH
jgi:hypothetical protein